jgi:hypothetical protein
MKRHLMTLILSGFVGSLVLVGNAEACHKKRCSCAPTPCCAVVEPAPCPPPAPVCEPACAPRKHCGLFSGFKGIKLGGCFHKRSCAPAPCAAAPAPCGPVAYAAAPVTYAAPVYSSPQGSAQH